VKPGQRRLKGNRVEREIVKLHAMIGVKAERVPLSGAMRFQGNGEDIDIIVAPGRDGSGTLHAQVKAQGGPRGTKGVIDALGEADVLFIRYDRQDGESRVRPPLVVLPWRTWERLLK
jgi:hypothetical protein